MRKSKQQVAVILNADLPDVGFAGELLVVRPGFARNFLLPNRHAELATPGKRKQRETEIAKAEARRQSEVTDRQGLATDLGAEPLKLTLKVGPDGQAFGSITATEVAKQLKAQRKLEVAAKQLSGLPTSQLGRQTVSAKLGLGVSAQIPLEITPERVKSEKAEPSPAANATT